MPCRLAGERGTHGHTGRPAGGSDRGGGIGEGSGGGAASIGEAAIGTAAQAHKGAGGRREREKTSVEALLRLYYEELDRARPSLLAHDAANDRLQVALIALYAAKRVVSA